MNKAGALLLRWVGINRPRPTTRLGRCWRGAERTLAVLLALYLGLQAYPQALFAHSVTSQGITLYSQSPLRAEAAQCADRAAELLRQSELAAPGRHERVFLCNSPWMFRLFNPASAGVFAVSMPLTDNVFIAEGDCQRDLAHGGAPVYNTRSLSGVVAHEITHGLIRRRLGLLRGVRLPDWVAEGYCDYVAQGGSFPDGAGRRLMAAGESDPSMSFRYFEYRQMVSYLKGVQYRSFAEIVARAGDEAGVRAETRQALKQARK